MINNKFPLAPSYPAISDIRVIAFQYEFQEKTNIYGVHGGKRIGSGEVYLTEVTPEPPQ